MGWIEDIWSALWAALSIPFSTADTVMIGYVESAIEFTPNLSTPAVQHVWVLVYAVFLGALGIAVAGIGLLYICTGVVEKKVELKFLWTRLAFALVLGGSSMLIGNFAIELANQLTLGLLSGVKINIFSQGYWTNSIDALGPGAFIVYLLALIFLVLVLIENGVRILMVFFAGAILPWGFLLWSFPTLQAYGTKIIRMFFEWTFVSVFMAIVLAMTVQILGGSGTGNDLLDAFLFLGGLALVAAMPKVMTETGHAVSSVGSSVLGGVGAAASAAAGGFAAGATGGLGAAGGAGGMAAGGAGKSGQGSTKLGGSGGSAVGSPGWAGKLMAHNPIGGAGALGGIVAGQFIGRAAQAGVKGVQAAVGAGRRHWNVQRSDAQGVPKEDAKAMAMGNFSPSSAKGQTFSPPSGGIVGKGSEKGRSYADLEKKFDLAGGEGVYRASVATRRRVHDLGQDIRERNQAKYHAIRRRVGGTAP